VLQERGQAPEAEHDFAATIATPTGIRRPDLHGNWLRSLQLVPGITPERLLAEHRAWDERHASPLRSNRPHPKRSAALGRPLRLGLVSPDLGQHPVGQFTISWLPHVDRGKVEVYCYSDRGAEDWLTADIRAAAAVFVDVREQSDDQLAARIEADEIDILCDLAGHTRLNRLLMFARRPAPVQLSWIGYPGTTGLSAMDGLIADRHVIPPEEEANYVERVLRLPHGWLCYSPPAGAPAIGPPPCVERGYVTFGCFNNTSKINAEVIALWSELLAQTPRSRLMLKFKWFDDPATCDHFADWFARHGIERWRLELRGWSDQHTHLAAYSEIDLALDTFPYTGGVTTCEALWMGVPVVSLVGRTFAERQSLSHLTNLGLAEWAAASKFAYVAQALGLARDPKRLAEWRGTLRERVANSPLCAGAAFARDLTALLLQAATNA
jgi:predicted O-linked N-acetylglucosamine transferase (SPINDLY family)